MDRDTEATLHRKNTRTEFDKMTTNGRIEDLVRQFMILPKETRREYSIAVGEREYGFREIESLAWELVFRSLNAKCSGGWLTMGLLQEACGAHRACAILSREKEARRV